MNPVERSEVLPLGDYEAIRGPFRARIIADKQYRRVAVGDDISVVFENRDTVLLQIQEMLRTERITKDAAIQHEIDTYNELVPGDDQLSMTLFIEINDKERRDKTLQDCAGIEKHVYLEVDGERFAAQAGEREGATDDRTTAVQYYLVTVGAEAAKRLKSGDVESVALATDHPNYTARAVLSPDTVRQLAGDLAWG
jgi:Protein of unknown function (DUF3501)